MNKMLVTAVCSAAMSVCFAQGTAAPAGANAAGGVDLAALAERLSQLESAMKNPSPDVGTAVPPKNVAVLSVPLRIAVM